MYGVALVVYLHPRRVDQEGHVIVHHLNDGVGRLPAVFLEMGVVDPDLPLPRLAPSRKTPVGECGPISVYRRAVLQVRRVDPTVVLAGEFLDLRCLILRHLLPDTGHDLVQKLVFHQHRHASLGGSLLPGKSIIVRQELPGQGREDRLPGSENLSLSSVLEACLYLTPTASVLRSYWTQVGLVTPK